MIARAVNCVEHAAISFEEREREMTHIEGAEKLGINVERSKSLEEKLGRQLIEELMSPEAKLGIKVEALWDDQELLLSPSEKLNSCFESIPVSSFPPSSLSKIIEINSDASLADAVDVLSKHKILSAPVRNVEAEEGSSWIDQYIGIVEFAGISVWLLHQIEVGERTTNGLTVTGPVNGDLVADAGVGTAARSGCSDTEAAPSMGGDFFETFTSSVFYKNTKVRDIAGSFRWAPFLALQGSDSFLTMLLLLSKYGMKSLPVVDLGEGKIENVITQSSVVHVLAECVKLPWFQNWGRKKLSELGLPIMKPDELVKVHEDEPILQAFKMMNEKGIGGVPVVDSSGLKPIGNISVRDVQYLLTAPEIYKDFISISTKNFLTAVRGHLLEQHESSPILQGTITCTRVETLEEVILRLDGEKIQRIYVADEENIEGVITLRDIISKLVVEPPGYFGDFFDGVVPLPANSRV